jgi:hypothetical protein
MNMSTKTIKQAITKAEKLLVGNTAKEEKLDRRWQAIIEIGEYIQTDPQEVWLFIRKWGTHSSEDIRMAIATCLLEHLLEYQFSEFFPKVREACYQSKLFATTFSMCAKFGQAELSENSKAFIELKK